MDGHTDVLLKPGSDRLCGSLPNSNTSARFWDSSLNPIVLPACPSPSAVPHSSDSHVGAIVGVPLSLNDPVLTVDIYIHLDQPPIAWGHTPVRQEIALLALLCM